VIVLNTICGLAFGQFWPQLFYKPEAADWMKGLPWIASAMVFLLLFIWISLLVSFCNNAAQKPESDCGEDCAGFIYHQLQDESSVLSFEELVITSLCEIRDCHH